MPNTFFPTSHVSKPVNCASHDHTSHPPSPWYFLMALASKNMHTRQTWCCNITQNTTKYTTHNTKNIKKIFTSIGCGMAIIPWSKTWPWLPLPKLSMLSLLLSSIQQKMLNKNDSSTGNISTGNSARDAAQIGVAGAGWPC